MKKYACLLSIVFLIAFLPGCKNTNQTATTTTDTAFSGLSDDEKRLPQNALKGIDLADGLTATLFASEPMIGNPTNMDVDAKGRVWMCEAFNYRPKLNPEHATKAEGDRIMILEDTNGDGMADTAKVFYQGTDVNAALGIVVLGNKVIVSCSPNVFLFTDENGDDKPDKKEVLFTHVGGEQHDHAIHAFTFGADGKLYFNFGNAGEQLMDKAGKLIKDKDGSLITNKGMPYRQGMVFRMNTDGTEVEVLAHNFRNNYEAATDAFGTIWQSDNDDDGNQSTRINYVMEFGNYGYTDEMTGAGWRARRTNMEEEIPKRHWHQNDPGSIPNLLVTGAGSPAGMCVYEGNVLPADFINQMIHCDAGNNVVRAYPVTNNGAGYKATIKPLMEGKRDQWFRPVDVCTAPDGSLFVADWYDPGVGGHQMGDMNRGRIYRVTATNNKTYKLPELNLNTPEGAAQALTSANGATRYLAWQKLQAWGQQAEPALLNLWMGDNARNRARALWLLAKIVGKEDAYLQKALKDKDAQIRIVGLRAARQIKGDVVPYVQMVVNDNDPQVLREAAIALHHNSSPQAPQLWATLAKKYNGTDPWYLEALGIGADKQWDSFLTAWQTVAGEQMYASAGKQIMWRSRSDIALPVLANYITNDATSSAERFKYFRAFDFINSAKKENVLLGLLDYKGPNTNQIFLTTLNALKPEIYSTSTKVKAALEQTLTSVKGTQPYVDLVRRYKLTNQNETLLGLALTYPDSSLGRDAAGLLASGGGAMLLKNAIKSNDTTKAQAALKALSHAGTKESLEMMKAVIVDAGVPPALQKEGVLMLASGWNESEQLLNMVKANKLPKALQLTATTALANTYRKDIRTEALKYTSTAGAGGAALPPINALAKMNGDALAGKQVFLQTCGTCHQVGQQGNSFGPALSTIGSKLTRDALYVSIIHPDAGISFGYEGHVITLKDGNIVAGIITSETSEALELNTPGGIKKRYPKAQIASRKEMDNSMMPANLYQTINQQQLVNLVEYLYSLKDKTTAMR